MSEHLPAYMIPSYFVQLEDMPLTPSGKVDRKALDRYEATMTQEYVAPTSETERKLATLWAQVLEVANIGIHDNFFDLGGNSLLSVKLGMKIRETFGDHIPIVSIFRYLTISSFAQYLNQLDDTQALRNIDRTQEIDQGKNRMKKTMNLMKKRRK